MRGGEEKQSKNYGILGVHCWPQGPPLTIMSRPGRPECLTFLVWSQRPVNVQTPSVQILLNVSPP